VRTRSARRAPLVAMVAIGSALLLSGCGNVPPGTASVIDGTKISRSDVTELAEAQCAGISAAAKEQGQAPAAPRKQLLQQSLTLLMDIELSLQYGKAEGISPRPKEVAATYTQVEAPIKSLPKKYHDFMEGVFHRWAAGRDVMTQVGVQETGEQPSASNADALLQAGYQKREPWLKKADIVTDPRYGLSDISDSGGSDPSVSKAVSSFAKDANEAQPPAAWVSELPSSQKCG
jgi:hypothetical protein